MVKCVFSKKALLYFVLIRPGNIPQKHEKERMYTFHKNLSKSRIPNVFLYRNDLLIWK